MKIKDLDPTQSLAGIRFRYPGDNELYYWASQWMKGVWGQKEKGAEQIYPLFVEDISECMEWEVVTDETI